MRVNNEKEYEELSRLIGDLIYAHSDADPGKEIGNQIVERDKKYTELLSAYTTITKIRFWFKEIHKWLFFWLVITACGFCLYAAYSVITKVLTADSIQILVDAVPTVFTAFTAFVSTIIVVPATITKFLFNTKEDDNITTLIKHTQEHDASGINMLKDRFLKPTSTKSTQKSRQPFSDISDDQ